MHFNQGTRTSSVFARIYQKPEKWCKLPWSSKYDSSSRTFWEAPPAPNRKLKHPKTHLRTRRAPFNHQVLPVTSPATKSYNPISQAEQASASNELEHLPQGHSQISVVWESQTLFWYPAWIYSSSVHVSLYLQQHGPLKLSSLTPLTTSLRTTSSHIPFSTHQASINHPDCAHLLSSFLPYVQNSPLFLFPSSDVASLTPRQCSKGARAKVYLKKAKSAVKRRFCLSLQRWSWGGQMPAKLLDIETVIPAKCNLEDVHPLQNVSASHSAGNFRKLS